MTPRYVIADLDPGTDDAWALAVLLKAEKTQNVQILAITLVGGNTAIHHAVNNVARVLEAFDRTDIPVFRGAEKAFIPMEPPEDPAFHGDDGFGDMDWDTAPNLSFVRSERAPSAMQRLVTQYPKQVSFICCSPLTNIALAIKLYPTFADNIKEVFIMGGNYEAVGNTKVRCAEFNFYLDTEAAQIVFNSLKCPTTLLPIESVKKCTPIELSWRFNVIGIADHPFVHLMNPIEHKLFVSRGFSNWPIFDALLVAAWLFPEKIIQQQVMRNCDVELHGRDTRGMVAIDHKGSTVPNVNIIEEVISAGAKEVIQWAVTPDASAGPKTLLVN